MSQICSRMVTFIFSAYFGSHFYYYNNGKVEFIAEFYTWTIALIDIGSVLRHNDTSEVIVGNPN